MRAFGHIIPPTHFWTRQTYIPTYRRVSSRIFCLGGKNSLESLTTPTFVGTLYWHVINLFTDFYGKEQTLSFEGNANQMLILTKQKQNGKSFVGFFSPSIDLNQDSDHLLASSALVAGFPNLASLARLAVVLPVTTATVERSFSDMKLIKTRLRSRLGEETLNHSIEGPDKLNSEDLDGIIQYWKEKKLEN